MKRTMAARSSYYEDRNLLRIRERERRNQEAHQEKEFYLKITPLFGEPYKTNKGDELSSRIQRMLGNYEEVKELIGNNPHQTLFSRLKNLPPPGSHGRPGRPPHADGTQAPFQNLPQRGPPPLPLGPAPAGSSSSGSSMQAPKKPSGLDYSRPPPGYRASPSASPDPRREKSRAWPDLDEEEEEAEEEEEEGGGDSPPPVLPALTPPADPLSPLHSSGNASDSEPQEPDDGDGPAPRPRPEARDVPPQAGEGAPLPSQTFPPPLPSKPNPVMPQKPTAYVRPMDGQDQAPSQSPDLKPSPEDFRGQSYENLPDLKNGGGGGGKPGLSTLKLPQPIEALPNEAHCVEEILREMTHSWPPPLTAIHTPSSAEPSKFSFPTKEPQHVHSGLSGKRCYGSSPKAPPSKGQQASSTAQSAGAASAHSSGGESGSSSETESTSGSESDSESSESANEEVPPPPRSSPPPPKTDDAPTENKWQLHNWFKISQQNSSADGQGDRTQALSPVPKRSHKEEGTATPTKNSKSQTPQLPPRFSDDEVKPAREGSCGQLGCLRSPVRSTDSRGQRKTVGSKHPSKAALAPRSEDTKPGLRVETVEVSVRDTESAFTERPKAKRKPGREKTSSKSKSRKSAKLESSEGKKPKDSAPKDESAPTGKSELEAGASPSPTPVRQPPSLPNAHAVRSDKPTKKSKQKHGTRPPTDEKKRRVSRKAEQNRASALVVKIRLSLLSRVPRPQAKTAPPPTGAQEPADGKRPEKEKGDGGKPSSQGSRKREAEKEGQTLPRKCPKLEKEVKPSSSNQSSRKNKAPGGTGKERDRRKEKTQPVSCDLPKASGRKQRPAETAETSKSRDGGQTAKHKKSTTKRANHPKAGQKSTKGSSASSVLAKPDGGPAQSRPLLKFEDRQYPVEHHMKEAKKLKHKADATSDKVGKAFDYLDAAMSFVESGIAMETDPQTPKSAYTMFSETMDLIRFILKLKNSIDSSAPASEKDFVVLCMRCQSLLQMAMFRYKREAALKYSRTLSEHFKNSSRSVRAPSPCVSKSTGTPSPMSPMPSPAGSAGSGPGSNHSGGGGGGGGATVVIPQVVQQMASSYINITALFLGAHDTWEQAEALAQGGGGLLPELDFALGPLSLTSSMSLLVRHTRQGLHWLRLDSSAA